MDGLVNMHESDSLIVQTPERVELERFVCYLEDTTKAVETWPSWKQEVLGAQLTLGSAAKQPASSALSTRSRAQN